MEARLQGQVFTILGQWLVALVLWPGLLFTGVVALSGEWLAVVVPSLFAGRAARGQGSRPVFVQPLLDVVKLAGRDNHSGWAATLPIPESGGAVMRALASLVAVAPLFAILLMPVPGSPLNSATLPYDIVVVPALLVIYPLMGAVSRLAAGGVSALRGGQDLGRLLTGIVPALVSIAALAEVSSSRTLSLGSLTAAPETASQFLVRLLAGVVLFLSLPWLAGTREQNETTPALLIGGLFQHVALALLWVVLVLPLPGDFIWALLVAPPATLFAYVGMRLVYERWAVGRGLAGKASLAWSASMPAGVVALVVALWWPG